MAKSRNRPKTSNVDIGHSVLLVDNDSFVADRMTQVLKPPKMQSGTRASVKMALFEEEQEPNRDSSEADIRKSSKIKAYRQNKSKMRKRE